MLYILNFGEYENKNVEEILEGPENYTEKIINIERKWLDKYIEISNINKWHEIINKGWFETEKRKFFTEHDFPYENHIHATAEDLIKNHGFIRHDFEEV